MSKRQLFPDIFYKTQRRAQKENSEPDTHAQLRCIKCCLCYRVIPRSQWQNAKCERALHLPYNTALLQSVQQALPSFSVKNTAFPTSLCPTCKRKIYDYLSHKEKLSATPEAPTPSHKASQFSKYEKEILEREVFYASYERRLRTKDDEIKESGCGGEKSCAICKAPGGIPKHGYSGALGLRRVFRAKKKLRAATKKKAIQSKRTRKSLPKKPSTSQSQPQSGTPRATRSSKQPLCDTPLPENKRRKRTVITTPSPAQSQPNVAEQLDTLHGMASVMGASDNAISRGQNYARRRAKEAGLPLPVSGHTYIKDSTYLNHAFDGDFEAREFPISGDGFAYFVTNILWFFLKILYLAHRYVRFCKNIEEAEKLRINQVK